MQIMFPNDSLLQVYVDDGGVFSIGLLLMLDGLDSFSGLAVIVRFVFLERLWCPSYVQFILRCRFPRTKDKADPEALLSISFQLFRSTLVD